MNGTTFAFKDQAFENLNGFLLRREPGVLVS
jgi:hypothetical protein